MISEVIVILLVEGEEEVVQEVYKWMREVGVEIEERMAVYKWFRERVE